MEAKDIWVVEIDVNTGIFHIQQLDQTISDNVRKLKDKQQQSWLIVAAASSSKEANELCDRIEKNGLS